MNRHDLDLTARMLGVSESTTEESLEEGTVRVSPELLARLEKLTQKLSASERLMAASFLVDSASASLEGGASTEVAAAALEAKFDKIRRNLIKLARHYNKD